MATKLPMQPCSYPGCSNYREPSYRFCLKHIKLWQEQQKERSQQYERSRMSAYKRGYNDKWREARKEFLKLNPLCVECKSQGRLTPATDVDHIVPHKGDKSLFWDKSNWQALCHACHSRKTAKEDGAFSNPIKH